MHRFIVNLNGSLKRFEGLSDSILYETVICHLEDTFYPKLNCFSLNDEMNHRQFYCSNVSTEQF